MWVLPTITISSFLNDVDQVQRYHCNSFIRVWFQQQLNESFDIVEFWFYFLIFFEKGVLNIQALDIDFGDQLRGISNFQQIE